MNDSLAIPKGKVVQRPGREPDLISKRGVPYWFAPEWVRDLSTVSRIKAITSIHPNGKKIVTLHMVSKEGNASFIQGSIQREFQRWCHDRQFEAILFGVPIEQLTAADWEYVDPASQRPPQ